MRPLAQASSALRQPLDLILGTPAAVRILRVMAQYGSPLSPPHIAQRAAITRSGTNKALAHLSELRVVETVGQGRYVSYQLNSRHPLAPALIALFQAERQRLDGIFDTVRRAAEAISPKPIAVWLFGSGARGDDRIESDLDIALVGTPDQGPVQADALRDALFEVSDALAFQPSVIMVTQADLERMKQNDTAFWQNLTRDAVPLLGASPEQVAHG